MTPPDKKIQKVFSFAFAVILIFTFSGSVSQSLISTNYSVEHGLPSSETYDIIQDSKDFIWVASDRGVCRFDGYSFKTFTTENGLTDNTVFRIYEDHKGRIWFITFNGKLCYYQNDSIYPYKHNKLLDTLHKKKVVRSFHVRNDTIMIGYLYVGFITIYPNGKVKQDLWPNNSHLYYAEDIGNELVLATDGPPFPSQFNKIYKINHFRFKNQSISINTEYKRNLYSTNILGLKRKNGSYLLYCPGTLIEIKKTGDYKFISTEGKIIYRIYEDRDSCVWISYKDKGVSRYGPNRSVESAFFDQYLNGASISSIMEDNERGFWFTTLNNGVFYIPFIQLQLMDKYQLNNTVNISIINSDVLLLYKNGTTDLLNTSDRSVKHNVYTGKNTAAYCGVSKNSECWIGGDSGITVKKNNTYNHFKSYACRKVLFTPDNQFTWALTTYELIKGKSDKPGSILESVALPVRTDDIFFDRKNRLWLGTLNGLLLFDPATKTFSAPYSDPLLSARITEIKEMHSEIYVLASVGNGVLILDKNRIQQISEKNGLCSNIVNGIAIDGDSIWVATNKGLSRITVNNTGDYAVENFNVYNGLPTDELRKVVLTNDYIWIATGKGTVRLNKKNITVQHPDPKIYITALMVGDKKTNHKDTILILNHDYGLVRIDFTGLSFKRKGNVNYKYKLSGLNNDWNYTSVPFVQFTSLDPGNYSFEVYAQNENGVWSSVPAKLGITVMKPFWSTWWFIALISVAGASLVFLFIHFRLRQQRHKSEMLETINNLHLNALASQMNPHFIFNSLTSIQAFVLKEDTLNASLFLSKFSKLMRMELENIRKQFVTVERETELLEHYLKLEQLRFNSLFEYELSIDDRINRESTLIPTMMIQPYVENSIKHGIQDLETKGVIRITISLNNDLLVCSVEDNGIGREASRKSKPVNNKSAHESAGMNVTEQRLKLLCESMQTTYFHNITDITTGNGKPGGTLVQFVLPFKFQESEK